MAGMVRTRGMKRKAETEMEKASAPQDLPPSTSAGGVGVQANEGEECIGEGRGEELIKV